MALEGQSPASYFTLPTIASGPVEVRRLQRELEALEEYMAQAHIRDQGKQVPLPKVSRILDALATNNMMNLLLGPDREKLVNFLRDVEHKAPILHISFATDPSSAFTSKVVTWLRTNIHPYALLQLGLQPNIAAGCIVRTNSKVFDFSLRDRFRRQRQLLVASIEENVVLR